MKIRTIGTVAVAAIVLFGGVAVPAQATDNYTTLVINQDAPKLTTTSFAFGTDTEFIVTFSAPLSIAKTKKSGEIVGRLTVLDIGGEQGTSQTRYRDISFLLPGGQIIAAGASEYVTSQIELQLSRPVTIAIIGGTGKYLGARGEVTTRRNADGTYQHRVKLLK